MRTISEDLKSHYLAVIADLASDRAKLTFPRHERSIDQRKQELLAKLVELEKRPNSDLGEALWELEHEAECRGWQTAHDKRQCGHPIAFYQDKNWPISEQNYDPETRSSEPPMNYLCLLCDAEERIADSDERCARLMREKEALRELLQAFPRQADPSPQAECVHGEDWAICESCKY